MKDFEDQNNLQRVEELNRVNSNLNLQISKSKEIIKSQKESMIYLTEENEKLKLSLQELNPKLKQFESSYEQFESKVDIIEIL